MNNHKKKGMVPRLRFPEFRGEDEWQLKALSNCLDYLQPTNYLVTSTAYDDKYPTPVLTAGKTFILGYTNENSGIFHEYLPVIIFDDFTTASKYVDFPFKIKSSAIKILRAKKDISIRFVYESMQNIQFDTATHKRHWISVFSEIKIPATNILEQQKIADCLHSIDELITECTQKMALLKSHKKGLMQQLFPGEGKTIPELRFGEFRGNEGWSQDKLKNVVSTITPPKKLPTALYKNMGKYPIIDQSQSNNCGRTDNIESLIFDNLPLIIFGDHTCILKIARKPFAQGADGIKILKAKNHLITEYLFQALQHNPVVMEEYKRHFSMLKEKVIAFPGKATDEQQKIADCLSSLDELITAHTQKLALLKSHKKALMQQLFPDIDGIN